MKPCCLALTFCVLLSPLARAHAEEPDDTRILDQILQTRDAIRQTIGNQSPAIGAVFLTFWDFDGTIVKGDCTEGLKAGDRSYPGLAELAIEGGLSDIYRPDGGTAQFWGDYTNLLRIGPWLAYPFASQMLRGAKAEEVLNLSRRHFAHTLSNYLMASSLKIIRALDHAGLETHIISASPDLFVKGAAEILPVPRDHFHGIEVRVRDGWLTGELLYPVTWSTGKRDKLQAIVAQIERERPGRKVFVLAGFGDSYTTDGPFLKYIATQSLPAGKPIAVFYDSTSEPDEYRGLFYQARHSSTVGE